MIQPVLNKLDRKTVYEQTLIAYNNHINNNDMIGLCTALSEAVEYLGVYSCIKGTEIYVLFSDICRQDYLLFQVVLRIVPKETLIDAAKRQDYSGRELPEIKNVVSNYDLLFNN